MLISKVIFVSAVAVVLFISSCTNPQESIENNLPQLLNNYLPASTDDGYILVTGDYLAGSNMGNHHARAIFKGANDSLTYSGIVTVDGFTLDTTGHGYPYYASAQFQPDGRTIAVVVSGSNTVNAFSDSLLVPEDISLDRINQVNKSGTTISWTPSSLTSQVGLLITYRGKLSQREDSSLPGTDVYVSKVVPDNGSYTFTAQELSQFAIGGLAEISLYRGSSKRFTVGGKQYGIYSVFKSEQIDIPIAQ